MKQEDQKFFSFQDIVNTALTNPDAIRGKKSILDEGDFSLNVISDLTYSNIWNSFTKWCIDQTELGYLIDIFSFGKMFYVSEKTNEGILIKFSDFFLKEHNLKIDEKKSIYDKQFKLKYSNLQPQIEKLNLIAISTELNTKKILVQNGLNNLFNTIGYLLQNNHICTIDLGILGIIHSNNLIIYQIPSKVKNDAVMNKKTTIQSLIERIKKNPEEKKEEEEKNKNDIIQNENIDNLQMGYQTQEAWKMKEEIEKRIKDEKTPKKKYSNKEMQEINNAKKVITNAIKDNNYYNINSEEKQKMKI